MKKSHGWNRKTTLSFSNVGGYSLSVKYRTFCFSNALNIYEMPNGEAEENALVFYGRWQFLFEGSEKYEKHLLVQQKNAFVF